MQKKFTSALPPLNWLRVFEATARHLSFTKAGQELGLTQSAISQQIRHLEGHLGEDLFFRRARKVWLTDVGQAYLVVVQKAFYQLLSGTAEVFGKESVGHIHIRGFSSFMHSWLATHIFGFLSEYPLVDLQLSHIPWARPFDWDIYDFEILVGRGDWDVSHAICLTPLDVIAVSGARLNNQITELSDILSYSAVDIIGNPDRMDLWLEANGLQQKRHKSVLQVDSASLAFMMAQTNQAVSYLYKQLIVDDLEAGRVIQIGTESVPAKHSLYLLYDRDFPPNSIQYNFINWIQSQFYQSDNS